MVSPRRTSTSKCGACKHTGTSDAVFVIWRQAICNMKSQHVLAKHKTEALLCPPKRGVFRDRATDIKCWVLINVKVAAYDFDITLCFECPPSLIR